MRESDPGIKFVRQRGGEENDRAGRRQRASRLLDERFPDPLLLMVEVNREVGKISDIRKIGKRAGNSDQLRAVPRRDDQIRALEHSLHDAPIVNRSSCPERGRHVELDDLVEIEVVSGLVMDIRHGIGLRPTRGGAPRS